MPLAPGEAGPGAAPEWMAARMLWTLSLTAASSVSISDCPAQHHPRQTQERKETCHPVCTTPPLAASLIEAGRRPERRDSERTESLLARRAGLSVLAPTAWLCGAPGHRCPRPCSAAPFCPSLSCTGKLLHRALLHRHPCGNRVEVILSVRLCVHAVACERAGAGEGPAP